MFQQNGTSGSTNSLVKSCKFSAKRVTSIKFDTVEGAKNKIAIKINATEWYIPFLHEASFVYAFAASSVRPRNENSRWPTTFDFPPRNRRSLSSRGHYSSSKRCRIDHKLFRLDRAERDAIYVRLKKSKSKFKYVLFST